MVCMSDTFSYANTLLKFKGYHPQQNNFLQLPPLWHLEKQMGSLPLAESIITRIKSSLPCESVVSLDWAVFNVSSPPTQYRLSGRQFYRCCKDDRQSQWGMAKFDPQPMLNPLTNRHQIWNTFFGWYLLTKISSICPRNFVPIYQKYTPKTLECLLHFFSSHEPSYKWGHWTDFRV